MKHINLKIPDNVQLKEHEIQLLFAAYLYKSGKLSLKETLSFFGITESELKSLNNQTHPFSNEGDTQSSVNEPEQTPKMKPGLAKGLIAIKPGFDEPLDDFKDYM